MNKLLRQGIVILVNIAICSLAALCPASAVGDQVPSHPGGVVRLSVEQTRSFSTAIAALVTQLHAAFVVEGSPLHMRLSDKAVPDISKGQPATIAVKAIANAYGYDVERRDQVFILEKRYDNPNDLPPVTLEECEQVLKNCQGIATPYSPKVQTNKVINIYNAHLRQETYRVYDPFVNDFALSLSAAQLQGMHEQELLVSSLSPAQQALVHRVALYFYVQGPLETLDTSVVRLQQLDQEAVFHWGTLGSEQHLFGYDLYTRRGNSVYFTALSGTFATSTTLETVHFYSTSPSSSIVPDDPTTPTPSDADTSDASQETLATVIASLNAHPSNGVHFSVSPFIQAMPATVAGIENTSPEQIMEALSAVYGLRLTGSDTKTEELALPLVSHPADVTGVSDAVRAALPGSLLRAFHLNEALAVSIHLFNPSTVDKVSGPLDAEHSASTGAANEVEETPAQLQAAIAERKDRLFSNQTIQPLLEQQRRFRDLPKAIRLAAIRRLRSLAEPKIETASPKQVPIASLGQAGRSALALVLMADCLSEIHPLVSRQAPGYVRNLGSSTVSGGLDKTQTDEPIFTLSLTSPHKQSDAYEDVQIGSDYIK